MGFPLNMFCDYCKCKNCQEGCDWLSHAQTDNGTWICDVCYAYDLCMSPGSNRNWKGPCDNKDCEHRPKIISKWIKYEEQK